MVAGTMAPAPEVSPKFKAVVGDAGKTNIFRDLFVVNHGKCWLYQHVQQFP